MKSRPEKSPRVTHVNCLRRKGFGLLQDLAIGFGFGDADLWVATGTSQPSDGILKGFNVIEQMFEMVWRFLDFQFDHPILFHCRLLCSAQFFGISSRISLNSTVVCAFWLEEISIAALSSHLSWIESAVT
jgi:hypothetical protein